VNNLLHGIVGEYSHGQIIFCPGHKTFDMVRIAIFESGPDVYPEYWSSPPTGRGFPAGKDPNM